MLNWEVQKAKHNEQDWWEDGCSRVAPHNYAEEGKLENRAKTRDCVIMFWIHWKSFLYNYTLNLLSYISVLLKMCSVDPCKWSRPLVDTLHVQVLQLRVSSYHEVWLDNIQKVFTREASTILGEPGCSSITSKKKDINDTYISKKQIDQNPWLWSTRYIMPFIRYHDAEFQRNLAQYTRVLGLNDDRLIGPGFRSDCSPSIDPQPRAAEHSHSSIKTYQYPTQNRKKCSPFTI